MKKSILAGILAFTLLLSLAACSGSNSNSGSGSGEAKASGSGLVQILLKNAGIEIGEGDDKVNIVYFDSQKDAYAALQNDTIDAASVYSPYASLAEGQGYKIVYRCSEEEALK